MRSRYRDGRGNELESVRQEREERCRWKKGYHEARDPWCAKKCMAMHKNT
jgi:hypothetical protein